VAANFNSFLASQLRGHRILDVEGQLQVRTDAITIRGKYDLITEAPDGALRLWDWKTGRAPRADWFTDYRNQKIQLGVYAVWMRYHMKAENVKGTAVFLREVCETMSERFTRSVEEDVLSYLASWRQEANSWSTYPAVPSNLCPWCGWRPVCPAFVGDI
jgi:putative RecB family exonuclease